MEESTDYILELEENVYKANKTSIELLKQLKDAEDEIETLKSISLKSKYVIDYLDSFVDAAGDYFQVYHIVNSLYEVNNWTA